MLLELIATVVLGLAAAGLLMALNTFSGKRLPAWAVPAGAGLAMLVFIIGMEYTWADRTRDGLPEGVEIASVSRDTMWYRPWTYIRPLTLRMIAVDTRRNRHHPDTPQQVMTTVLLLQRWMPVHDIPVVFDCAGMRRADLHSGVELLEGGRLANADWRRLDRDDPSARIACRDTVSEGF